MDERPDLDDDEFIAAMRIDRYTDKVKKVMELAMREAVGLGHNYIGTEHLLLAIIREGNGIAAQTLQESGRDLAEWRREVVRILNRIANGPYDEQGPLVRLQKVRQEIDDVMNLLKPPRSREQPGV